jgi:hypothetical protein
MKTTLLQQDFVSKKIRYSYELPLKGYTPGAACGR